MRCDPERVSGYVDGELPATAAAVIRRHLLSCSACSSQADFEIGCGGLLRSAFGHEDAVPASEAVVGSFRVRGVGDVDAVVQKELVEVSPAPARH